MSGIALYFHFGKTLIPETETQFAMAVSNGGEKARSGGGWLRECGWRDGVEWSEVVGGCHMGEGRG